MISHTHAIGKEWKTDGNMDAMTIRIADTGVKDTPYVLTNQISRAIVGAQIILRNKPVNMHVVSADINKIVVQFDSDNADINLRIW